MNDFREANFTSTRLCTWRRKGDFPFWRGFGLGLRAALIAREGRTAESRALSSESFATLDAISVCWFRPFIFSTLAESFLHAGEPDAASGYVAAGVSLMEQTGERWIDPYLRRLTTEVAPLLETKAKRPKTHLGH